MATDEFGDGAVAVGGPGEAPPIAFVHGAGLSRQMWLPQLRAIAADFRVIAPDLPGHGRRADERFSLSTAATVVAEAIAGATDRPALVVGQSLGAYVAVALADREPDRVAGLVLSGAGANYTWLLGLRTRLAGWLMRLRALRASRRDAFAERIADALEAGDLPRDVVAAIREGGVSLSGYGRGATALAGFDAHARLEGFDGPVLLLNGEGDRINPGPAARLADGLPRARADVLDDAGHTCNLDRPDAYTEAVRSFAETAVWPERAVEE
ncbi:MAG: alpha/beta fold hydrolase [Haloarculaceae archaeon]